MASQRQIQSSDQKTEQVSIPPHSTEAEQAVLGGIMLSNQHWDGIAERVIAEDFYTFAHKAIFQTMEELMRNQTPIDLITLDQALKAKGISDSVGGFAYLADLSNNTPNAINILAYAEIVREKAILRELIAVGNRIAENSYSPKGKDIKMVLDEAEREVFAIAEKRSSSTEGPQNVLSVLESTIARIETLGKLENHNGVTGVTTGFVDLDKKTAGLQPSDLIIVAARPSMGKTTFAMNLCENAAMASDKPVLVFSLEMPAEQIMMRMIASLARVDQTKFVQAKTWKKRNGAKLPACLGCLSKKTIFILMIHRG